MKLTWNRKTWIALLAVLALLVLPATAQQGETQNNEAQPDPYLQPDDTWISISGTVDTVRPDAFDLDYGDGVVTVEMDDGDRDADAYKLVKGDKVTVYGFIDDDFFEATTIEASSVYVEGLDTYFYASGLDEEDSFISITRPIVVGETRVQGTVTAVSDEEFIVDTGLRRVEVEIDELGYNPLDDEGYLRIEVGDVVSVGGVMDTDFLEGRELVADWVVELVD